MKVLDWGTLTYDIANGVTEVPGATLEYDLNSFKVNKDDKHQNILSGYLYALMAYCAITGETAVGQPYDFCYPSGSEVYPVNSRFEFESFLSSYYKSADDTNFPEIFESEADMAGLQQLTNEYIKEGSMPWKKYLYTVTLEENGGTAVDDLTIWFNKSIYDKLPDHMTREGYVFNGWYKDESLTAPVIAGDTVTSDMTVYAKWTAVSNTEFTNVNSSNFNDSSTLPTQVTAASGNVISGNATATDSSVLIDTTTEASDVFIKTLPHLSVMKQKKQITEFTILLMKL